MSRTAAGAPEALTATGTTTAPGVGRRQRVSESGAIVSTSGACASRRRSTARCHTPWRPGRFSAAIASSQIDPGPRPQQRGGDRAVDHRARAVRGDAPAPRRGAAASAWTRSVQHERAHLAAPGPVSTLTVRAPARPNAAASSRAGRAPAGGGADGDDQDIGGRVRRRRPSGASDRGARGRDAEAPLSSIRLRAEARGAHQLDRLQRRGALDVEAGAVALLDRRHRRRLAPPRERPDDREAGGDRRDLGQRRTPSAPAPSVREQQRPQAVEDGAAPG